MSGVRDRVETGTWNQARGADSVRDRQEAILLAPEHEGRLREAAQFGIVEHLALAGRSGGLGRA